MLACIVLAGGGCSDSDDSKRTPPGPPDPEPLKLTLSDPGPMTFTIRIESADPQTNYYVGVTTREDFERLETPEAVAGAFVQIENERGEIDWTKADGQLVHNGSKTIDAGKQWNLLPKRKYAVIVFGVGAEGAITVAPVYDFVTTTAVSPSENRLTVKVEPETAVVTVTTTNGDPYFLDCIEADRIEDYPTDRLAEFLIGSYGGNIDACIEQGDVERDFSRLVEEDTDYYAVAFGYLGGYPTTEIEIVPFHTAGGELVPQDCTFTFDVTGITTTNAGITVTPSNPTTPYFWQVYNKTLVESYRQGQGLPQLMADGLAIIAETLSEQYGIEITPETAAGIVSVRGEDSYLYDNLSPSTDYYVLAVGLDGKGRQTTEVQLSRLFTTLSPAAGPDTPMDCTIQVNGTTDEGLSVTVTPADKQMTYVGMAGEAEHYAEFPSDAEYLVDDLAFWTEMASAEQMSLVEMLSAFGLFLQGDQTYIFPESFVPGTLYLAYTYGMDEKGTLTTGMQKVFFTVDENGDAHAAEAPSGASLAGAAALSAPRLAALRPAPAAVRAFRPGNPGSEARPATKREVARF